MIFCVQAPKSDLAYLHQVAHEVCDSARVAPGAEIPGSGRNTTGYALRAPGGTLTYYPAFWVRDAAMMLGADLVPEAEIEGWIRVIAKTQPGLAGLRFDHGLYVPPFSIPDHVTLDGRACWYPGAYTEQGVGDYGFLPPADDAFYFVQIVYEAWCQRPSVLSEEVETGWGSHPLKEVCEKAFESVAAESDSGCVVCQSDPHTTRVDWGFCDSVRKTGKCLMPTLLRWQAARRMNSMGITTFRDQEKRIRRSLEATFYVPITEEEGYLRSATGLGNQDDIWASAFALWLGVLDRKTEKRISRHLQRLYRSGAIAVDGQVRELPVDQYWNQSSAGKDTYQNGGYWGTPTGWMVKALAKTDRKQAGKLLHEYVQFIRDSRGKGAPFEWINPATNAYANPNYGSSAGLVYAAVAR
ncbi:MAG TPA: hypothetical protein VG944_16080 [Fimbriimonas sp.]|nr:hypothetical protein [Fimbriimonas sp.]